MPAVMTVSAVAYGAAFGLFPIGWIVFWAIVLYRITVETGNFDVIKDSLATLTADRRLQAILIAFALSGFIEGAAGFGTRCLQPERPACWRRSDPAWSWECCRRATAASSPPQPGSCSCRS
jgi:hypothetical protein